MPRRLLPFLVLTALAFSTALPSAQAAADRPYIYWFSQPVKPGETAMLQGEGWTAGATVSLARLADAAPGEPQAPPPLSLPLGPVPPLQARELSLKFVVPANQEMGIFACRVAEGDLTSDVILLNAPQVWWCQGDWGGEASPGGWLRVFGRCLSLGEATLALRQPGQKATLLKLKQQDTWSLAADLPATLPAGEYEVWVHNGKGGPSGWAQGGTVRIAAHPPVWGDRVFNVVDYGAIPDDDLDDSLPFRQALDAAANHGSGLVYFPGGRFYVEGRFDIPSRVLVKGAGQAFTHLSWPDTSEPPDFLLTGTDNFGIEDLGIFAINHRGILQTTGKGSVPAANIFVRRVTIQANRFCRPLTKEQTDQRRAQARGDSGLVLSGENVQLTDCDIKLDAGMMCAVHGDGGLIARNHFASLTDLGGWTPIGGTRIINEENTYWGITTGAGRCAELYWSHNQVSSTFSGFREGFTTDGTGGGPGEMKITAVNGTEMTAEKPLGRGESQKTPGAIHILTGTGAGQWRRLVSWKGNTFSVDRPWDVLPDETSVVSGSNFMGHFIMVGNTWTDTGIAIQLYGAALECVLAHNTSIRSGGFRIWGKQTGPGPTPCWYDE
ncbi:MAG: hypothetical protein GX100_11750, partial [candidate division WS1 bacterium]|nr:hypothetical protein [candidate division WS1 bacterium]